MNTHTHTHIQYIYIYIYIYMEFNCGSDGDTHYIVHICIYNIYIE